MCTIEKANSLVNRMMEEDSLSTLGALIVDELHMVRTCCAHLLDMPEAVRTAMHGHRGCSGCAKP